VKDGTRAAILAGGYSTPYALNSASAYSLARDKDFANRTLDARGLPTITPSRLFFVHARKAASRSPGRELADALAFAREADYPVFCKPNDGGRGVFAQRVKDAGEFAAYVERVAQEHEAILVQPVIQGTEYRVFVLKGRALFSYRKLPAREGAPANRSQGGGAVDFTDAPPVHLADIAVAAAGALDLSLAGVDLFDIAGRLVVIEANANPAIETLEAQARWDLIETIWGANFEAAFCSPVCKARGGGQE
jgi:glutathione synthase/RimK-type ligase-like ATP-grasp enzyme